MGIKFVVARPVVPGFFDGFTYNGSGMTPDGDCLNVVDVNPVEGSYGYIDMGAGFFGAAQDIEITVKYNISSLNGDGALLFAGVSSHIGTLNDVASAGGNAYGPMMLAQGVGQFRASGFRMYNGSAAHNQAVTILSADTDYWLKFTLERTGVFPNIEIAVYSDAEMSSLVTLGNGLVSHPDDQGVCRYILISTGDWWSATDKTTGTICDMNFIQPLI